MDIKLSILFMLLCLGFYLFHYKYFNSYMKKMMHLQKERENHTTYLTEMIEGYESIKGLERTKEVISDGMNRRSKLITIEKDLNDFLNNIQFKKNMFVEFMYVIVIIYALYLINNTHFNLSSLFMIYIFIQNGMGAFKNMVDFTFQYSEAKYIIIRNMELSYNMNEEGTIDNFDNYDISFNNVSFNYNKNDVLKNIDYKIKTGCKVIVLGESGSGKTTMFQLLKRYYTKYHGSINIGSHEISLYNDTAFEDILYVSQQERLFKGTVSDNITLGQAYDEDLIKEICEICNVSKELNDLVLENGFNLSGGERKRIILARSFIRPFKIMIVDESLGQMDSNLERIILKNIFKKFNDRTIIVISHRRDHMDLFDQVLVLNKGKVVDKFIRKE